MLKIDYLQQILVIAIALSTITCALIQKIKIHFKTSRYLCVISLVINILLSIVFCITFTSITFPESLWVGLFSFIGADTIYKSLEGKLASHKDIVNSKTISIPKKNIINEGEK